MDLGFLPFFSSSVTTLAIYVVCYTHVHAFMYMYFHVSNSTDSVLQFGALLYPCHYPHIYIKEEVGIETDEEYGVSVPS